MIDIRGLSAQEGGGMVLGASTSSSDDRNQALLNSAELAYANQLRQQGITYGSIASSISRTELTVVLYTGGVIVTLAPYALGAMGVAGFSAEAGVGTLASTLGKGAIDIYDATKQTVVSSAVSTATTLGELGKSLVNFWSAL